MASAHGTRSRYVQGCHCSDCSAADAAYKTERRNTRTLMLRRGQLESAHGNVSTYTNDGCRCESCTAAHASYLRQWRARRKVSA